MPPHTFPAYFALFSPVPPEKNASANTKSTLMRNPLLPFSIALATSHQPPAPSNIDPTNPTAIR